MNVQQSDNRETAVTEDPPVCVWPARCWRTHACALEVARLKKEEDLGRERATSCFLSLMTWAKAAEALR